MPSYFGWHSDFRIPYEGIFAGIPSLSDLYLGGDQNADGDSDPDAPDKRII